MFVYPGKTESYKEPAEIGPRPWHHRSDCFVCRKQEGIGSGSSSIDPEDHSNCGQPQSHYRNM
jgi:hypothetical protein